MNQYITPCQCTLDKVVGFIKMWGHLVGGDIIGGDNFMIDSSILGILDTKHSSNGENYMDYCMIPEVIFFCLSRE
jgi:hypothetical protein